MDVFGVGAWVRRRPTASGLVAAGLVGAGVVAILAGLFLQTWALYVAGVVLITLGGTLSLVRRLVLPPLGIRRAMPGMALVYGVLLVAVGVWALLTLAGRP